jgi:1-acyl-sn-glycerol-3-phosphate acyltransferase
MWLLPHLPRVSRWIAHTMHRISAVEGSIPADGPVLLVSNHPNALIDPVVVTAAAARPIRWLAKSTLVYQPAIGWLFRAAGAIPVYRRQDDERQMGRNADTFAAAIAALRDGSAVALFPEGISHTLPGLAPMKTGAARLALQAAAELGHPIPIIPAGVIYGDAAIFRSPAGVVIGPPVPWDDLAGRGPEDRAAVAELTERIGAGLGEVTRQLESWADQPVIEQAAAVVAAEAPVGQPPPSWIARASGIHGILDQRDDPMLPALRNRIQRHARALGRLGMTPSQLAGHQPPATSRLWRGWRAPLVALIWAIGLVYTWIPYRLTGQIVNRLTHHRDLLATLKAVVGFLLFVGWIAGGAVVIGFAAGWPWGVLAVPLGAVLSTVTLQLDESRHAAHAADRSARHQQRRSQHYQALRLEQEALAEALLGVERSLSGASPPEAPRSD